MNSRRGKATIQDSTFDFLKKLARNNNRDWFNAHKERYLLAKENVESFLDQLIIKMNTHDQLETPSGKKALYRIYNDVRFSKDKTPYNPRFAGHLRRNKPMLRGGYYFWIKPGGSRLGCGFTYPNPNDLKRIRLEISHNYVAWNKLLNAKAIQANFGVMMGDTVNTAPKGFSRDHPAIDLLRYKQYWFERAFTDKEVLDNSFLDNANKTFKSIRPFFDYMSEILSTDSNGQPLVH
ncbi:MAG: DUF2461 domain-containing protein [Cyclobacteriaceae bacterium]|nr:DUF2461 domain-containing protein [Cyclobacteriaceae bacterium]